MKTNLKFKICFAVLVSCLTMSTLVEAKKYNRGGFVDNRSGAFEVISVEKAKDSPDDSYVVLQGYIDSTVGNEKYLFRDETGTIKIEIDDKDFRGLTVYPDDLVQISGEVDKDWWSETEIDVKNISKVNPETSKQ